MIVVKKTQPIITTFFIDNNIQIIQTTGAITYEQPNNASLSNKIESVEYNAALAIKGAIKGTSKEKLYQELGCESFKNGRWLRHLCYLYKIASTKMPPNLHKILSPL